MWYFNVLKDCLYELKTHSKYLKLWAFYLKWLKSLKKYYQNLL